jgi:hypothetical protein
MRKVAGLVLVVAGRGDDPMSTATHDLSMTAAPDPAVPGDLGADRRRHLDGAENAGRRAPVVVLEDSRGGVDCAAAAPTIVRNRPLKRSPCLRLRAAAAAARMVGPFGLSGCVGRERT